MIREVAAEDERAGFPSASTVGEDKEEGAA